MRSLFHLANYAPERKNSLGRLCSYPHETARSHKNLVLPLKEIEKITWKWVVFPVATFHMTNGEKYKIIIYNKRRFEKWYKEM